MIQSLGLIDRLPPELFSSASCLHFEFMHEADYAEPQRQDHLHILVLNESGRLHAVLTEQDIGMLLEEWTINNVSQLAAVADELTTSPVCLSSPMALDPVHIPKPWGQEIWYSGIEARGVCTTSGVSLAWLIDVFGEHIGCAGAPVLLKILDPFPAANLGDLYFEMHEQKIEVYVVTHVDETAWEDAVGQIRYGFNQSHMAEYKSVEDFLGAYVDAVNHYRKIRSRIDEQLAKARDHQGISRTAALTPHQQEALQHEVDASLIKEEVQRREAMYRFTALKPITQGDVITVRPLVPHSLQHGVRVIEFQTPHYERYILSFGQQVLTQDHWDTEKALSLAVTEDVQFDKPTPLNEGIDLVADFNEFRVERITLAPGDNFNRNDGRYAMLIGVSGKTELSSSIEAATLEAERAFFVPSGVPVQIKNAGNTPAIFLFAQEN